MDRQADSPPEDRSETVRLSGLVICKNEVDNIDRCLSSLRFCDEIVVVDSESNEHSVSVIRCLEIKPDSKGELKTTRFKWITNFTVKIINVIELANQGGRLRWKIENEGFNVQKNGGYALEHIYTHHPVSAKVFYLLLQLAHTLAQLIERGSLFRQAFPAGVGSAKNLAFRLLEAWRNARLSAQQIQHILSIRVQIRFQPP
jgi:glycosyltransferase involved in cell wall biosynthesis